MKGDDDRLILARVRKLLVAQAELMLKLALITDELDAVWSGGASIGTRLKAFETVFGEVWETRYRQKYLFVPTRDRASLKRLLLAFEDADLHARVVVYLRNGDPFYVKARHPFGLFVRSINEHVAERPVDGMERPEGCSCEPACASEQAHTKRMRAASRGELFAGGNDGR